MLTSAQFAGFDRCFVSNISISGKNRDAGIPKAWEIPWRSFTLGLASTVCSMIL